MLIWPSCAYKKKNSTAQAVSPLPVPAAPNGEKPVPNGRKQAENGANPPLSGLGRSGENGPGNAKASWRKRQ
jgi:hypothetical protein